MNMMPGVNRCRYVKAGVAKHVDFEAGGERYKLHNKPMTTNHRKARKKYGVKAMK